MKTPATLSDTALAERYARLDAFLAALRHDIYPEPPSEIHAAITRQGFANLQSLFPIPVGARVLDVGCGQGVALAMFTEARLDPVGVTLGTDAQVCRERGFKVVEADFSVLDFPDASFDVVWCRHAIEHSVFPFFTLSELHRVLRPGGCVYVEAPAPDTVAHHEVNPNHYSVFGRSMWMQLLVRVGFEQLQVQEIGLSLEAGPDTFWAFYGAKAA